MYTVAHVQRALHSPIIRNCTVDKLGHKLGHKQGHQQGHLVLYTVKAPAAYLTA